MGYFLLFLLLHNLFLLLILQEFTSDMGLMSCEEQDSSPVPDAIAAGSGEEPAAHGVSEEEGGQAPQDIPPQQTKG